MIRRLSWWGSAFLVLILIARADEIVLYHRGAPYVDLSEWAAQKSLRTKSTGNQVEFTNRWTRMFFRGDSKKWELNGVTVSLLYPALARDRRWLVSRLDVEKNLNPLYSQPKAKPGEKIETIAIGAGHGGKDPGNRIGKREEKEYTLKLAFELEQQLKRAGFKVVMIRRTDQFIDLYERPALAKRKGADLYLSLHYNAYDGPGSDTARGVETYCLTPPGASSTNDQGSHSMPGTPGNKFDTPNIQLAWAIHKSLVNQSGLDDRGVKRARFLELTQMSMPAVLIEGGFMTHPEDAKSIFSAESRRELAEAIVDGVLAYKRTRERE